MESDVCLVVCEGFDVKEVSRSSTKAPEDRKWSHAGGILIYVDMYTVRLQRLRLVPPNANLLIRAAAADPLAIGTPVKREHLVLVAR